MDRLAQGPWHVLGAGRLGAPLDQGLGQLRCIDVGQHRLDADHRAHLLAGGDHQRAVGVPGIGQGAHAIAGAGRGVQVDEGRLAAGQGEAVGHAHHRAFMQAEDVAEVFGEALEKGQLVGTRVAEHGGQALLPQDVVGGAMDGFHMDLCRCFLEFELLLQPPRN